MSALALSLPAVENFAQIAVERVLNSLPEGLLLAACAWLLLRVLGKQNAGTRFAVWLTVLVGVAGLPLLGGMHAGGEALRVAAHAELTVPGVWAVVCAAVWIPIACIALARLAAGFWQVRALRRSCAEIEVEMLGPAQREALEPAGQASARRVRLLTSETARVPAAIGFRHPAIVLPAWCLRELKPEELQPILIHEMAHLRRRDDWTNLFQKFVRALLFFHPAVWWIDARLSLEREMACDDAVLAATGNAHAYAGSLIGLLERGCARRGWTMAQAAVARAREASARIARILTGGGSATTRVGRGALGLAAALCLTAFGVLESAPQMVAFAPQGVSVQAAGDSVTGGDAVVADGAEHEDLHRAEVVPALYRPDAMGASAVRRAAEMHRVAARAATTEERSAPAERLAALKRAHPATPGVVMAKMDENAAKKSPLVHEAVIFGTVPSAAGPSGQVAQGRAVTGQVLTGQVAIGRAANGQVVMVVETAETQVIAGLPAYGATHKTDAKGSVQSGARAIQIRTVQVVEQDETGVHVRTYRVELMVPAAQAGLLAAAI